MQAAIFLSFIFLVIFAVSTTAFHVMGGPAARVVQTRGNLLMRERKCDISGKRRNAKCMNVSKSHARTKKVQNVNLQTKKLWWEEEQKFVRVRIATKTLRTIQKNGLGPTAKKFGVDLDQFAISSGVAPAVTEELQDA